MYKPYSAEAIDTFAGRYSPNTRMINSEAFWFWVRAFMGRAMSVIDFENLPDDWDNDTVDVLYFWLYREGFVGVIDSDKYGLVFQFGNLYGRDLYYRPKKFIVANPNASELSGEYEINENAALIKLTPDYRGIYDIIERYAEKMANLDNSVNISIENLKLTKIITAENKAAAETIKKIKDLASRGEALITVDKLLKTDENGDLPFNIYDLPNLKQSYILTDQLKDMKTIIDMFDMEIGIPVLNTEKKERLISDEANYDQASARAEIWVRTLNKSMQKVNEMFGTDMSAKLHYNYNKGDQSDGNNETDDATDGAGTEL